MARDARRIDSVRGARRMRKDETRSSDFAKRGAARELQGAGHGNLVIPWAESLFARSLDTSVGQNDVIDITIDSERNCGRTQRCKGYLEGARKELGYRYQEATA